ncbi:nitric oxide reductase activation protein NorD [Thiococcus pfennigii]|uniref:nitric oxide reductase activation protein NorD n=1 Tax=Thiococcus pfennigii TaxID=1057 RepID=UPI001902F198|nr:VWA domain-containing protein [Thiococcus pfennigii]MBK1699612.1 VWA domain-containing protein [Thiococcus pfennigii]
MNIDLNEYGDYLEHLNPEIRGVLEGTFHEAARAMSPSGLQHYLEGAKGLSNLGRGNDLIITYLQEMPLVAREIGEEAVQESLLAAMKLSSMTSGEVIGLFFAALPTAARRLGDMTLFRAYLQFLHQLAARAPRGLRPMLGILDELLSKLTLGGLRRWAFFGASAHRTDYKTQLAYFALQTADSQAMLQKERKGTLFIDHQRKLSAYLRALWGRDFWLRPAAADRSEFKPYLDGFILHLPDAADDLGALKGLDVYRAIAAHLAAHIAYTSAPISAQELNPAQMNLIGLIEDARVEYNAIRELPGLKPLWRTLLTMEQGSRTEHKAQAWLEALALHLLDAETPTGDAELDALARTFHANIEANRHDNLFSWHLGIELYHLLAARQALPSLRQLEALRLPYRDDNRFVWQFEAFSWERSIEILQGQRQVRRRISLMEFVNEVDVETAGDDAQEVWILDGTLFDDDGTTYNEKYGKEPVSDPFHYHEWDYQVQLHRPDWVTLYERRMPKEDPDTIDAIIRRHKPIASRLRQIVDRLRPQGVIRERKLEDGDELDLNAAVDAMVNMRAGLDYDPRITMRYVLKRRDLAVLILLDLSESTNEEVRGTDNTVIGLTREAAALLATAVGHIGDPYAIHGFCSDGRHDVKYYPIKAFEGRFDDEAKGRLAGLHGGYSTRMGAALRHAGRHLLHQPQRKKLLLLVTDGEPADIDERDPQYLRHDAKRAVEELRTQGVNSFCLTLDPNADRYVERIFGPNGYTIVDRVERLPERLPQLFVELTG